MQAKKTTYIRVPKLFANGSNKYMIEFSEHATYTGWNNVALYGEFYRGLAERIKDQLLNLDCP